MCADMPARDDAKGMVKPTGYYSCEVCHARAVPMVMKKKKKAGHDDEDEDTQRTVLTWPDRTMDKELRTLESVREQSDLAKNNPGIDPKMNFGQKGILVITRVC